MLELSLAVGRDPLSSKNKCFFAVEVMLMTNRDCGPSDKMIKLVFAVFIAGNLFIAFTQS